MVAVNLIHLFVVAWIPRLVTIMHKLWVPVSVTTLLALVALIRWLAITKQTQRWLDFAATLATPWLMVVGVLGPTAVKIPVYLVMVKVRLVLVLIQPPHMVVTHALV